MIERPRMHAMEDAEFTGQLYIENLGLHWEVLRGKEVLDIGAGNAEFEQAARQRAVNVTSLNKVFEEDYAPSQDSKYVVGHSTGLPFKDSLFDYILAHMSVTNYAGADDSAEGYLRYLEDSLREACRVLKPDGEFRFMDTRLDVSPEEEHKLLEEVAKRAGFRELIIKKHRELSETQKEYNVSHYYIAIK